MQCILQGIRFLNKHAVYLLSPQEFYQLKPSRLNE